MTGLSGWIIGVNPIPSKIEEDELKKRTFTPVSVLMGVLLLALAAAMTLFVADSNIAHAQANDDATLSALGVTSVTLSPTFSSTTMKYTARAGSTVNNVTVMATANNATNGAKVSISPGDSDSVTTGHQVSLTDGRNTTITVTVTAANGVTKETYTVKIYKERTNPSTDNKLKSLSLTGATLSPSFSSGTTAYTGRAVNSSDQITVNYTADAGATFPTQTPADANASKDGWQVNLTAGANTVITLGVQAEANGDTRNHTITVYRENTVLSDNSALNTDSGLTLDASNSGTISGFTYAATTTSYPNVRVNNVGDVITVGTSTAQLGAKANIAPSDADSQTDGHQVVLAAGQKTNITVTVTAEDKTTTTDYKVTIYRQNRVLSQDNNLSALSVSGGGALSPTFASGTTSYTARVPYTTDETTVSYTTKHVGARSVVISPDDADTAKDGHQVDLNQGVNTSITVSVLPEDTDITDAKVYTVAVYRENLSKNANTNLASDGLSLNPSSGNLEGFTYAAATKSYPSVTAPNETQYVTVVATPAQAGASAAISPADGSSVVDGHQVVLAAGQKTTITVTVTAEDGSTTGTYTVTIFRAGLTPSNDNNLSALSLEDATLSPTFDKGKISYTARVSYSNNQPTVSYTTSHPGASVAIQDSGGSGIPDANSNKDGHQVPVGAGAETIIRVVVDPEDDNASDKTYTITVYRENLPLSNNARLSALALTYPTDQTIGTDQGYTFVSATMSYPNVRVPNAAAVITVAPTKSNLGAMMEITPDDADSLTIGRQVVLTAGQKTDITVEVTAEDGTTTETYSVTIYRERNSKSTDNKLSALELSDVTLSPPFDKDKGDYIGRAAYSTDMTTVSYTADIGATVAIGTEDADDSTAGHQVRLKRLTATRITVTVTPEVGAGENNVNNKAYEILVYRDTEPSSDASLLTLSLSDLTLVPAFSAGTTSYTAEVNNLTKTTVAATAAHPGATVEGTGEVALVVGSNTVTVTVTAEDDTTQTYTVMVTVHEGLLAQYDENNDGRIDKNEALRAIDDYLIHGTITKDQVLTVIDLYLTG